MTSTISLVSASILTSDSGFTVGAPPARESSATTATATSATSATRPPRSIAPARASLGHPLGIQGREVARKTLDVELIETLEVVDVFEAIRAEISHRDARELGVYELARGVRQEDLPAVADCADTRRTMHSDADVALPSDGRLPGVQAHPHSHHVVAVRPVVGGKSALREYGRSERGVRGREREEEGLALVIDLTAASLFDRFPQDLLMLGEDGSVPLAQLLQSRVEPSMSVNRNVTVPVGSSVSRSPFGAPGADPMPQPMLVTWLGSHSGEIGRRVLPHSSCAQQHTPTKEQARCAPFGEGTG